ncbi:unnamed protein product [Strongylus vulgaris]|uniref:Ground-like domain-containing protein n=1 Tax=Strongylus vulgaris TaxID=40348 RepID=A0A3P7J224_STRVU|nr:unnamed protein product [Strongylus vulgaris]
MILLVFLVALFIPGGAQILDSSNIPGNPTTYIQHKPQNRNLAQKKSIQSPDIVVERNGVSQFNFGPLPSSPILSRVRSSKKDKKFVQSSTFVENRGRKISNHPNRERNNHRIVSVHTFKQRNNSAAKANLQLETPARIGPAQKHFPPENTPSQLERTPAVSVSSQERIQSEDVPSQEEEQNDEDFEELTEQPTNTFSKLENKTFQDNLVLNQIPLEYTYLNMKFEAIVGLSDYAQRVNFKKDLVCKVEIAGRYMLAYATPDHDSDRTKRGEDEIPSIDEILSSTTLHSVAL